LALALISSAAQAQRAHHRHRTYRAHAVHHATAFSGAENGLIGIHLFDTGEHVIGVYGSPDDIQPLTFGGTQQSSGFGGGGGGFGAPGGAGGPAGGRGLGGPGGPGRLPGRPGMGGGGSPPPSSDEETPGDLRSQFEFGDPMLQQRARGGFPGAPPGMPGGAPGPGGMGGRPGMPGRQGGGAGFPGAPGRGGGGAGAGVPNSGGAAESVTYTRWIYNRSNNKFAFVVNRLGQVIQIEAIGLSNPKVRTKRGIEFGSQFGAIVKAYHNPDGYDIGGDNILVKYLVNDKVAFRLTRLAEKKPHQVTGIVVSAGKG
jgi:hypothetical protein